MDKFEAMLQAHEEDTLVAFAGDWHGRDYFARRKMDYAAEQGARLILHVGDFGLWPGPTGKRYLNAMSKKCQELDTDIVVTVGNHEDHARLELRWENAKTHDDEGYLLPLEMAPRIWFLPRAFLFEVRGVSFLSSGGAASVDLDVRTKDRDWWVQEIITHEQIARSIELAPADVLITHESPDVPYAVERVERIVATNPMGFSELGISYSAVSRKRCTALLEGVKPKLHVHGHFHEPGTKTFTLEGASHSTKVLSLGDENSAHNLAYLELEKLDESIAAL